MDIGQIFNDFWTQWGALIISIVSSGAFGTIVVAVVKSMIGRFANKSRSAELTDGQVNNIADRVASRIAGNVLDVDVSRVVTDATREELADIKAELATLKKAIANTSESTALMAKGISRSKLLSEQEQTDLVKAAETLEKVTAQAERAHINVVVEPSEQAEKAEENVSLVNFGG